MAEKRIALWKRILLYAGFSVVALFAAFFITFPYDALSERLKLEADNAGYNLKIGSMGPGFFALNANELFIAKKMAPTEEKPPEALKIDKLSVGPTLFPPGLGVSAKLLGGALSVRVSALGGSVHVDADDLDLSKGNLKGFSGIDLAGKVDVKLDLSIPKTAVGASAPEPDLSQASGAFSLSARGLTVNGGTVSVPLPMYGPDPTPLDLPKIAFGDLGGHVKFEKGAGTVDEFKSHSNDLEIAVSGTLKLAKKVEYSDSNLEVRFKPDPDFQKRLGLIGSALSMVGADPKDPTWRMGRLTGLLGKPNFR